MFQYRYTEQQSKTGSAGLQLQPAGNSAEADVRGKLTVQVLSAENLHSVRVLSLMDCYVEVQYAGHCKQATRVHVGGDRNPVWDQTITADIWGASTDEVVFSVYDRSEVSSVLVGTARVPVAQLILEQTLVKLPLTRGDNGDRVGDLLVRSSWQQWVAPVVVKKKKKVEDDE